MNPGSFRLIPGVFRSKSGQNPLTFIPDQVRLSPVKVLLANPSPKVWASPKVPPLGLGYVAAALERAGHSVSIWDAVVTPNRPSLAGYDVVGATAVSPQIHEAWAILEEAKAAGAMTVVGGPHATVLPEESLGHRAVDVVVRQEGEVTLPEVLRRWGAAERLAGLPGISWRDGNRIINEPDAAAIRDLDPVPFPAHHLFPDPHLYTGPQPLLSPRTPALAIFTSRGCPYGCTFCYKGTFGYGFRARSPENVAEEWDLLVNRYKVAEIAVQDDIFNFNLPRAIAICEEIINRRLQVPWCTPNGIRADRVSRELFRAMREAGCERVSFGVETGNEDVMKKLQKHETLDQIRNAFELAHEAGIRTTGFFMFGNLGETRESMEDTINFAIELNPTWAQFTMATPYPGTKLYEMVRRDGDPLIRDWEEYGHYTSKTFFRMGSVTPELLRHEMKKAYRKFYLRFPKLRDFGLDPMVWNNLGASLRGAWHLLARA